MFLTVFGALVADIFQNFFVLLVIFEFVFRHHVHENEDFCGGTNATHVTQPFDLSQTMINISILSA